MSNAIAVAHMDRSRARRDGGPTPDRDRPAPPGPHQVPAIPVSSLKVALPLRPDQLPPRLVPPEPHPAGNPMLDLSLGGTTIRMKMGVE